MSRVVYSWKRWCDTRMRKSFNSRVLYSYFRTSLVLIIQAFVMGFKAELFVKSVDENLFCSICHEVFEDPVNCKDGHTFCKDCITTWLKKNKKCPLDNGTLEENQLVRVFTVKGIIDNLDVHCHLHDNVNLDDSLTASVEVQDFEVRCDWVGKLQQLKQHRETCPFQEVQCPHGCNEKVQRRKLEDHENTCEQKLVDCGECSVNLPRKDLEKHKANECLQALVPCPNKYMNSEEETLIKNIKRIDVQDHVTNDCPKTEVDCPYKEHGCGVKVERQDVGKHVQDNRDAHMMLLAKQCSMLTKQNTTLTEQCSSFVRKNAQLNNELSQVKKNLEKVRAEIPNTYTWTIRDFRSRAKIRHFHFFRSPTFWLSGHCWYLKIYPNGKKDNRGTVSLYLFPCCNDSTHGTSGEVMAPNDGVSVFFRLKVLSQHPFKEDESHESNEVFSYEEGDTGYGWHFMKTNLALSPAYCSDDGGLAVQCTIWPGEPQWT